MNLSDKDYLSRDNRSLMQDNDTLMVCKMAETSAKTMVLVDVIKK